MHDPPRVYVTRQIPAAGMDRLEDECEVFVWDDPDAPPRDHLVDRLADLKADGLFCNVADTVDAEVIDASPNLRSIATMSVGYDHIDLEAAAERDVTVGHTPGVLSETTADLAWALLMAAARRIVEADQQVHDGKWNAWGPTILLGRDVHDATLGVVGLGRIGMAFARRTAGFDMDVLYAHTSRNEAAESELAAYGIDAEYCTLEELLDRVDFLSIHVPLLEETKGLIGADELRRMDDEAVLINTARGEVLDMDALDTALENDRIRHAALDVTDPEPLPPTHSLLRHAPEKLTVTPHIGSASIETRGEMAAMTANNLLAGLDGETPPHSVFDDAEDE